MEDEKKGEEGRREREAGLHRLWTAPRVQAPGSPSFEDRPCPQPWAVSLLSPRILFCLVFVCLF